MRDALTNLFKMQPQNLIPQVNYLAGLVWLMVLICALFSLKSQKMGVIAKGVWGLAMVCVPFAGVLAYCLYCLLKLDLSMFPAFAEWKKSMGPPANANSGSPLLMKIDDSRGGKSKKTQKAQAPKQAIIAAERASTKRVIAEE